MAPSLRSILALFWPPAAPLGRHEPGSAAWWLLCCIVNIIPLTASFHHVVFFRPSCMLNPQEYGGDDYTWDVVRGWLTHDPSLYCAVGLSLLAWFLGRWLQWVRLLAAPFFVSFLPLSIWIWDIPGTSRWVCDHFHDARLSVNGVVISTKYMYLLGIALYSLFVAALILVRGRRGSSPIPAATTLR